MRLVFLLLDKPADEEDGANAHNNDAGAIHGNLADETCGFQFCPAMRDNFGLTRRHRIVAAVTERMTMANAFCRQSASSQNSA